jgi:hypothetical protein
MTMTAIYEGQQDKDGLTLQFTNCCGACDKGSGDAVVCRNCYNEIVDYYGVGDEGAFAQTIKDATLSAKFRARFCAKTVEE